MKQNVTLNVFLVWSVFYNHPVCMFKLMKNCRDMFPLLRILAVGCVYSHITLYLVSYCTGWSYVYIHTLPCILFVLYRMELRVYSHITLYLVCIVQDGATRILQQHMKGGVEHDVLTPRNTASPQSHQNRSRPPSRYTYNNKQPQQPQQNNNHNNTTIIDHTKSNQ